MITGHLRKIAGLEQEVKRLKKVRVPHMQAQNASCCQAMCICWRVLLTLSWWGAGPLVADVCACCSHCTIDLPGCNLSWRTCSCHLQVQRASGAFMVSHRRQSMGLPSGLGPPGLTGPAGAVMDTTSSMASEDAEAAEGSLADDEEFVAEEHAHRCTPCRPICHGCRRLLWALLQHRTVSFVADTMRTADQLALIGPRAVQKCLLFPHRSLRYTLTICPCRVGISALRPDGACALPMLLCLVLIYVPGRVEHLCLCCSHPHLVALSLTPPSHAPAGWNSSASRVRWTACSGLWKPRRPRCSA